MKTIFFLFCTFSCFGQDSLPKINTPKTNGKVEFELIDMCDQSMDAEFTGGPKAMQSYIAKNLVYPNCQNNEFSGKIYVSFIVEVNGDLSEIEVVKGSCQEMDEVLIKLFDKMPAWLPGANVHGVTGRTRVLVPVQICFL